MSLRVSLRVSLANPPHPFTKKSSTHTRTAFGDGNSKQESNQDPKVHSGAKKSINEGGFL